MRVGPRPVVLAGVLVITWAAILIRWAEAPALAIAFWRMAFAALCLGVVAGGARRRIWGEWRGVDWWTGAGAALLLALHFGFWIASLERTTVAASSILVSTQPVFVAILGWPTLRERPSRRAWTGILLAVVGAAVIAGGDLALDRRALLGDFLAVAGALWVSAYYVLARFIRATKDLVPYVTVVYTLTAGWLLLSAWVAGTPLHGYDGATWAALAALALGPTVFGHTAMNYALRYIRAYEVNVSILGEPIGAALWAALLLDEAPGAATWVGGGLVLAGIFLTQRRRLTPDEFTAANL